MTNRGSLRVQTGGKTDLSRRINVSWPDSCVDVSSVFEYSCQEDRFLWGQYHCLLFVVVVVVLAVMIKTMMMMMMMIISS